MRKSLLRAVHANTQNLITCIDLSRCCWQLRVIKPISRSIEQSSHMQRIFFSTPLNRSSIQMLWCRTGSEKLVQSSVANVTCRAKPRYLTTSNRDATPFTPKKVLIVSKVTLLNYESRKAYKRPWKSLSPDEKSKLSKCLQGLGFYMDELVESHGEA
jgi:hypothetical protein